MSEIRRLTIDDVDAYVEVRRAMLEESPQAFLANVETDIGCDAAKMRANLESGDDNAVYGAFGPDLIGAVGILRFTRHVKAAHRAELWGMWVHPDARGQGLGRALVDPAVFHARDKMPGARQVHLGGVVTQEAARRLYEGCGFQAWGTEPGAVLLDGRLYDETHMVLPLDVR